MSYGRQLLDTYPGTINADAGRLAATIDALSDCAQACVADADVDLREQDVSGMVTCIRLCWDCADVCTTTMGVASRQTAYAASVTRPLLLDVHMVDGVAGQAAICGGRQQSRIRLRRSPGRRWSGMPGRTI